MCVCLSVCRCGSTVIVSVSRLTSNITSVSAASRDLTARSAAHLPSQLPTCCLSYLPAILLIYINKSSNINTTSSSPQHSSAILNVCNSFVKICVFFTLHTFFQIMHIIFDLILASPQYRLSPHPLTYPPPASVSVSACCCLGQTLIWAVLQVNCFTIRFLCVLVFLLGSVYLCYG